MLVVFHTVIDMDVAFNLKTVDENVINTIIQDLFLVKTVERSRRAIKGAF